MIRKKFNEILVVNGAVYRLATLKSLSLASCEFCDVKSICIACGNICYRFNIGIDYHFVYDTEEISQSTRDRRSNT